MKKLFLLLLLSTPCYAGSVYIDQVGDSNVIYVDQSSSGNSEAILLNKGDSNNLSVVQGGSGDHLAFIGTPPVGQNNGAYITNNNASNNNSNTLTVLQSGSGNHTAAINLDSSVSNNNNNATITQSGAADKDFVLNLSGSNIGATILQDSATTPDNSNMNIQCYTGTCSGYSYSKH